MAIYTDKLPSMHLSGDELKDFEKAIKSNSTNEAFSIEIRKDSFRYELDSVDPIIEDFDIPDKVTDYSIDLECDEGTVRISANGLSGSRLRISGEKDWVRQKKRNIQSQTDKHKKILRTYSGHIIFGAFIIQWIWVFLMDLTGESNSELNLGLIDAALGLGFLILFFSWPFILEKALDYIYPKYLLKRDESVQYRPRLQQSIRIGLVLLTVIGGIGGAASLTSLI